jgi:hypothetical protein
MSASKTNFRIILAAFVCFLSHPRVMACAACFGQSDSNMAKGMNVGIFALLLVITCVLSGIGGFFLYLARRNAQAEPGFPAGFDPMSQPSTNV